MNYVWFYFSNLNSFFPQQRKHIKADLVVLLPLPIIVFILKTKNDAK